MVATAGAAMAAVDHVFGGAEPAKTGILVEAAGDRDRVAPRRCGMHIDLDDAGVGRHLDHVDARIGRRTVALDMDRHRELDGGRLDGGQKREIVGQLVDRRHEHA